LIHNISSLFLQNTEAFGTLIIMIPLLDKENIMWEKTLLLLVSDEHFFLLEFVAMILCNLRLSPFS
jgi:hypothetical protein